MGEQGTRYLVIEPYSSILDLVSYLIIKFHFVSWCFWK